MASGMAMAIGRAVQMGSLAAAVGTGRSTASETARATDTAVRTGARLQQGQGDRRYQGRRAHGGRYDMVRLSGSDKPGEGLVEDPERMLPAAVKQRIPHWSFRTLALIQSLFGLSSFSPSELDFTRGMNTRGSGGRIV